MKTNQSKVAIVTGSSRGIGAAIAKRLASDGLAVIVNYAGHAADAENVVQEIGRSLPKRGFRFVIWKIDSMLLVCGEKSRSSTSSDCTPAPQRDLFAG